MSVRQAASLLALGSSALAQTYTSTNPELASFNILNEGFRNILGATASITLLHTNPEPIFHEGAVYVQETDSLFVSSNRIPLPAGVYDNSTSDQTIKLTAVQGVSSNDTASIVVNPLDTATINLPNGGVRTSAHGILWCAQGSKTATAGIYTIPDPINAPNQSFPVVTDFFGRRFNGPNDVVTNPAEGDNTIWFTDVDYTVSQGLRDGASIKNHVYRFDPATNSTRAVADGFDKPNGLAFNAAGTVLYVTDVSADADENPQGEAGIYAFDVVNSPGPFLVNKRLFAFAPVGAPDGIKVDSQGNVWAGTGSGVMVWDQSGTALGEIAVTGGSANFGFGVTEKTVFVLGETNLFRVQLG